MIKTKLASKYGDRSLDIISAVDALSYSSTLVDQESWPTVSSPSAAQHSSCAAPQHAPIQQDQAKETPDDASLSTCLPASQASRPESHYRRRLQLAVQHRVNLTVHGLVEDCADLHPTSEWVGHDVAMNTDFQRIAVLLLGANNVYFHSHRNQIRATANDLNSVGFVSAYSWRTGLHHIYEHREPRQKDRTSAQATVSQVSVDIVDNAARGQTGVKDGI